MSDTGPRETQDLAKVALIGSTGRMGREVIAALDLHPHLTLGIAFGREHLESTSLAISLLENCDVIIDFSVVGAQTQLMKALEQLNGKAAIPLVTGVTGLSKEHQAKLNQYSRQAPVFQASNFSFGVALLKQLSKIAARALGEDFDAEIYELHHRHKMDAPSGTAISLAKAVVEGKRLAGDERASFSQVASTPRDQSIVQVSAGRGGGVFGDHSLLFLGEHERIELSHSALNRSVFASGALRAALWCLERGPGHYGMEDLWER